MVQQYKCKALKINFPHNLFLAIIQKGGRKCHLNGYYTHENQYFLWMSICFKPTRGNILKTVSYDISMTENDSINVYGLNQGESVHLS